MSDTRDQEPCTVLYSRKVKSIIEDPWDTGICILALQGGGIENPTLSSRKKQSEPNFMYFSASLEPMLPSPAVFNLLV